MLKWNLYLVVFFHILGCASNGDDEADGVNTITDYGFATSPAHDYVYLSWDFTSQANIQNYQLRKSSNSISTINDGALLVEANFADTGDSFHGYHRYKDTGFSVSEKDSTTVYYSLFTSTNGSDWVLNSNHAVTTHSAESLRQEMRDLVVAIKDYGVSVAGEGFAVVPNGGVQILTDDGTATGNLVDSYINKIDGQLRESVLYRSGESSANLSSSLDYLTKLRTSNQVPVLNLDYPNPSSQSAVDSFLSLSDSYDFIPYAEIGTSSTLASYPAPLTPHQTNSNDIDSVSKARNFTYLLSKNGRSDSEQISYLDNSNYDLLIIEPFISNSQNTMYSASQVSELKTKANGGRRLVIAYMSVGQLDNRRYYYDSSWDDSPPAWINITSVDHTNSYNIHFWENSWKNLLYGSEDAWLDRILELGYDGVFLDVVGAHQHFLP